LPPPLPDLESLRCFAQAARQQSFRRGAKACALSPAAFGERIRRLEDQLGAPLFTRTPRRLALTPEGERLLPRAQRLLDEAERCLLEFLDARGTTCSKVNMAASEAVAHSYLIRPDVERGAVARATTRLREALPLMQRAPGARQFAGTLAYLAAGQGRLRDAALLQGADVAGRQHRGEATPWLERKVAAAVRSRVLERHGEVELARWYAEGARLEEAAIAALARGD